MATGLKQRGRADFASSPTSPLVGMSPQGAAEEDFDRLIDRDAPPEGIQHQIRAVTRWWAESKVYQWDRFFHPLLRRAARLGPAGLRGRRGGHPRGVREVRRPGRHRAPEPRRRDPVVLVRHGVPPGPRRLGGPPRGMGFMIHDYVYDLIFSTGGVGAVRAGEKFTDAWVTTARGGLKDLRRDPVAGRRHRPLGRVDPAGLPDADDHRGRAAAELEHAKLVAARHGYS